MSGAVRLSDQIVEKRGEVADEFVHKQIQYFQLGALLLVGFHAQEGLGNGAIHKARNCLGRLYHSRYTAGGE